MRLAHTRADKVIVKEMKTTYGPMPIKSSDVVLDLGANIGAAAALMLEKGAKKVIAVEPDPRNVMLAKANLRKERASVIWAAVGEKAGRMPFYVSRDKPYLSSVIPDDKRQKVMVPVVTLGALLAEYRPTVVKCDIEFGEYNIPELYDLPDFVRVLAMELHVRMDGWFPTRRQTPEELTWQRQEAAALMASFEAQGFTLHKRRDKNANDGKAVDDTGLPPMLRSLDAIWVR